MAISLPRRDQAWHGGIVDDSPVLSVSAAGGTMIAATERIVRLRPGATQLQTRDTPAGFGDVTCVAVEPRWAGHRSRFAAGTIRELHIFDDRGVGSVKFPDDHDEVMGVMWAPLTGEASLTMCLYVRFPRLLLRVLPMEGKRPARFELDPWPLEGHRIVAMASDRGRGVALAVHDEERDELRVMTLADGKENRWSWRLLPTPSSLASVRLAIADRAVAVSFGGEGSVWLTRDLAGEDFAAVEEPRGADASYRPAPAIAFEGASADSALFVAKVEAEDRAAIVRFEAGGGGTRIAEVTREGDAGAQPQIHEMTWDATRKTLWSAAGRAGLMCTTAPGAPPPVGGKAGTRAPS